MIEHVGITLFICWYFFILFYVGLFRKTRLPFYDGIVAIGAIASFLEIGSGYTRTGMIQTVLTIILFAMLRLKPASERRLVKLFSLKGIVQILLSAFEVVILAFPIVLFHSTASHNAMSLPEANLSAIILRYLSFQLVAANMFYLHYPLPIILYIVAVAVWWSTVHFPEKGHQGDLMIHFRKPFSPLAGNDEFALFFNPMLEKTQEEFFSVQEKPFRLFIWAFRNWSWVEYLNNEDCIDVYEITGKMLDYSPRITPPVRVAATLGKMVDWLKAPYIFWGD